MSHSLPHLTLTTNTSSLSPFSSSSPICPTVSPSQTITMNLDPNIPCDGPRQSDGSTQIPSLTGSEPKSIGTKSIKTSRPEEWSLTGILGQICINYLKNSREITTKIFSLKIWMDLEKLVPRCPTSSHTCIPILTQRKSIADSTFGAPPAERSGASELHQNFAGQSPDSAEQQLYKTAGSLCWHEKHLRGSECARTPWSYDSSFVWGMCPSFSISTAGECCVVQRDPIRDDIESLRIF